MTHAAPQDPTAPVSIVSEWDKIFPRSDKVSHRKASFKNRYGITLVGDLYLPKEASGKLPAIAVGGPFGAVKEQSSTACRRKYPLRPAAAPTPPGRRCPACRQNRRPRFSPCPGVRQYPRAGG